MCKRRKSVEEENFVSESIDEKKIKIQEMDLEKAMKDYIHIDLNELYEKTVAELGLQQTKRDQIITVYIALFAFLIPAVLEAENMQIWMQGALLVVASIIGILFAQVIIRYRVYKEIYWLCCQSISFMFGIKEEYLTQQYIKDIFYKTLKKKGKDFYEDKQFSKKKYIKKSLFSSETIYYMIHILITSLVGGLGLGLVLPFHDYIRIGIGIICTVVVFLSLLREYFVKCIEVYQPLIDNLKESLKKTFSKAWFLHFDID